MNLDDYIDAIGINKISELLGVTRSTIHNWKNFKSPPTIEKAYKLIELSNGLLTLEGIYDEYAQRTFSK